MAIAYNTAIDTAIGGSGDDSFTVNGDADTINGGAGTNLVNFMGPISNYTLANDGSLVTVTSKTTSIIDSLTNVQTLQFSDQSVQTADIPCFLPDTRIATPSGELPVQDLVVGDMVLTHRGDVRPIRWIGHGKALATRGRRNAATPIIVYKGTLGHNTPSRDLHVTKGHALYLDDVLIPVEYLVNHRSIVWDDRAMEVMVYHIELDIHDVLLANGAPAESYRDDGNRWLFRNSNSGWNQSPKPRYAAVLTGGPIVDAVWMRLLALSGPRPGVPTTEDADVHLLVDGRRIDGRLQPNGTVGFRISGQPSCLKIISRTGAQDQLGLARDPRELGIALRNIVLWSHGRPTVVAIDDLCLSEGLHDYEVDNGSRWTNGEAVVPASLYKDGITSLDLDVAATTQYPLPQERILAAA